MTIETALLQYGLPGIMLLWFMLRVERKLERVESALDRMTRAQMLTLIARPDVEEPIKAQARAVLAELTPTYGATAPPK